jgi:hypothetical protein
MRDKIMPLKLRPLPAARCRSLKFNELPRITHSGEHTGDRMPGRSLRVVDGLSAELQYLDGDDMRKAPLTMRKANSPKLLRASSILFSQAFKTDRASTFEIACDMGLRVILSKRHDSRQRETLASKATVKIGR